MCVCVTGKELENKIQNILLKYNYVYKFKNFRTIRTKTHECAQRQIKFIDFQV